MKIWTIIRAAVLINSFVPAGALLAQSAAPAALQPGAAPIAGVAAQDIAFPQVSNFTLRQPFHSAIAEDALAIGRCVYSSRSGYEVDFTIRVFAGSERATKSLTQDVAHLKSGGRISSREFGRTAAGEYIEVARCTRNGIHWAHWVVGNNKFVAATRESKDLETFLAACPAWNASPRVQWQCAPLPAYKQAAAAKLPMVYYFFLHGEYCDIHERNILASPEFNALRDRAVFIAFEPDTDDEGGNRERKMKELNVTIFPTTSVIEVKGEGLAEIGRINGYHTPQEFHRIFGNGLNAIVSKPPFVPSAPALSPSKNALKPSAGFSSPRNDVRRF